MLKGLLVCFIIAILASFLGSYFSLAGSAVIAMAIGIIMKNYFKVLDKYDIKKGTLFSSKKILQFSIVIMGFTYNIQNILSIGFSSLKITLTTLFIAFFLTYFLSKILKTEFILSNLIAVGTAICGGSAIAAVSPILKASEKDISYAMSTIFLFNMIAAFIFPALGALLSLTQTQFGLWAGSAINDTSSVVAAGIAYGNESMEYATVVKLTRTTFIVPVSIVYTLIEGYRQKTEKKATNYFKIIPWFIVFFVIAVALNSTFPNIFCYFTNIIKYISKFLTSMALAGVGLLTDIRKIVSSGFKPILLGIFIWLAIIFSSLFMILF